jgi:uncharacterized protein
MNDADDTALLERLRAEIGAAGGPLQARDPVNLPMIRHWCDAMEDANPNYTEAAFAETGPHGSLVAPPAMLDAWTAIGNVPRVLDTRDPLGVVLTQLDAVGYVGVVATNSEHVYHRYLRLGDRLTATQKLVDVSERKATALGVGYFVTTETEYHDQHGGRVGSMFFRILKFRPGSGRTAKSEGDAAAPRTPRPRPSSNQDDAWFWEGCTRRELRVQTFSDGSHRYPPIVRNPATGEMPREPSWVVSSGRGRLYSYSVVHHPQVPTFDYPLVVGLIELEEGVRIVCNVLHCPREEVEIGMPLELCWLEDGDLVLPAFRPARPARRQTTLTFEEVSVGDRLPLCPVPITPTLIVAGAIASRDYQDVHHDRNQAQQKGSKDIFMNILTSSGLSSRYLNDWAGPHAAFKSLKLRLGVPNHPYDTMTFRGSVSAKERAGREGVVTVAYQGLNSLGAHVTGSAELVLPSRS